MKETLTMNGEMQPVGPSGRPRVVIADDHPLFREALRRLLGGCRDLELVGEAPDGARALELCRRLRPDLILMDVRMPRMDGLEATREIKRELPRTIVLVLTAFEEPKYLLAALKAGASGYVLKHAAPGRILDSIRRVLAGESPLDQEVGMGLLMRLIEGGTPEDAPAEQAPPGRSSGPRSIPGSLSPREAEVLGLMARGRTNQEISQQLFVSVSTVKKHVRQVISKLGVSDRTQAAIKAANLGLLAEEDG